MSNDKIVNNSETKLDKSPYHNSTLPIEPEGSPSSLRNCIFYDDIEWSNTNDSNSSETNRAIQILNAKVARTRLNIQEEQTARDDNVNEYLKLSSNADRQQALRIKQVFEKKNQKSAQSIAQLQRKLADYQRKIQEVEHERLYSTMAKTSSHVFHGLRNVINKPKEIAHKLRYRFGSADNLNNSGRAGSKEEIMDSARPLTQGSASLPRDSSLVNPDSIERHSSIGSGSNGKQKYPISDDGLRSDLSVASSDGIHVTTSSVLEPTLSPVPTRPNLTVGQEAPGGSEWKAVMEEMMLHREEVDRIREESVELRLHVHSLVESWEAQLQEQRDYVESLEEQVNDLIEFHQREMETIKSGISDMEEKMRYELDERFRDVREHMQVMETNVSSLEHQAAQQQYLNIEGLDSTNTRAVFVKLLTAAITLVHLILFLIGSLFIMIKPFLQTFNRAFITLVFLIGVISVYRQSGYLMFLTSWLKLANETTT